MNDLSFLSLLPEADQAELQAHALEVVKNKLSAVQQEEKQLQEQERQLQSRLLVIKDSLKKYEAALHSINLPKPSASTSQDTPLLPIETESLPSSISEGYNKSLPQQQRLLYIIKRPEAYGRVSFVGAKSVIAALFQEEPELKGQESEESLMKKVGPALSRLAMLEQLKRFSERNRPSNLHYLSSDWFENDVLKPEYQERLAPFDLVPVEKKPINNTANDTESLAAKESSSVVAEGDANSETSEGEPSVYAEQESSNGIMSLSETFQLR